MSSENNGLMGRALGYFAAATFIAASASQNALHGWQLGLRTSEITATIFAAASIAGAIMAPIALAAAFRSFRNFELGKGLVAGILAACCFVYAVVSSVGFVSGARDQAAASRSADADAYTLAKAKSDAAVAELKALANAPRGSRKVEAERAKRRTELETLIVSAEAAMADRHGAGQTDPTASAIAAYSLALGITVKPEALAPWLSLLAVIFFELGAAASLVVVAAPAARERRGPEMAPAQSIVSAGSVNEPAVPPEPAGKQRGRKRAKPLDVVVEKIQRNGRRLEGSMSDLGAMLGLSKSSAHRALHTLAAMGVVSLAASPAGTLVQLR